MPLSATPAAAVEFSAGVWTDVSEFTREAGWNRGSASDLDELPAGTGYAVLANADRRFDPEYAAGPHFGDLLPRKRIRIGFTYDGTTYWKFYGHVRGWPQAYHGPRDATVRVQAVDAFTLAARARVPSAWQQTIEARADTGAWWRLGESSGTLAADSSGANIHGTYVGGATFNSRASLIFGASDSAVEFNGVDQYVAFHGAANTGGASGFVVRIQLEEVSTAGRKCVFDLGPGLGNAYLAVYGSDAGADAGKVYAYINSFKCKSSGRVDNNAPHTIVMTTNGIGDCDVYVDGVDATTATADSFPSHVTPGEGYIGAYGGTEQFFPGIIDELVSLNDPPDANDAAAFHDAAAHPWAGDTPKQRIDRILDYLGIAAADRDLDDGSVVLMPFDGGGQDALSHMQAVALSEGGRFFVSRDGKWTLVGRQNLWGEAAYNTSNATFGDGAGEMRYSMTDGDLFDYDDENIINEARVRPHGGSEQVASDATSITDFGLLTRSESTLESRAGVVKNRAEYLVSKNAQPSLRMPEVTIQPERDPASLYPLVGGADIGYRYTFTRRPQAVGSAISKEVHLNGEAGRITPGAMSVRWELVPAEPSFFMWGVSEWGNDTRWGY